MELKLHMAFAIFVALLPLLREEEEIYSPKSFVSFSWAPAGLVVLATTELHFVF
jgi:hypothetical protein